MIGARPTGDTLDEDEFNAASPSSNARDESDVVNEDGDEFGDNHPDSESPEESLRQLVSYLATNLVDDPDAVEVEAERRGGGVLLILRVPEEELGRVIGRGGRIARAMRTVVMIAGSRHNLRASLDIEG